MRLMMRVALFSAFFVTMGCATVVPCDSSNCNGCCVDDVCRTGGEHDLCGAGACRQCGANQACSGQSCISAEMFDGISLQIAGFEGQDQLFLVDIPSGATRLTVDLDCEPNGYIDMKVSERWTYGSWIEGSSAGLTTNYPLSGRHDIRVSTSKDRYAPSCYNYHPELARPPAEYQGREYCEPEEYKCTLRADWY